MEYNLYRENKKLRCSYGIEVINCGKTVKLIPDMGEDRKNLKKLVALLNETDVELNQLDDIIEDYLTFFDI